MADELGNADEMIKAGLRAAGVPRETAQTPHGNPGSGSYSGADRTEAEGMIREALRNAPPPMRAGAARQHGRARPPDRRGDAESVR